MHAPKLPTVTGFAARQLTALLRERNVALAPLLQSAGLTKDDVFQRTDRISAAAQSKLLELASDALGDDALGLQLATRANPRDAGLLFYVVSAAKNIGEALTLLERYLRITNEAVHGKIIPKPNGAILQIDLVGLARHRVQQNAEFGIAVILRALREVAGRNIRPTEASFVLGHASKIRDFERFYGCPITFGAPADCLVFAAETLALPLVTQDVDLLETLKPVCDAALRERGTRKGTLRALVENEVQKMLARGKIGIPDIAKGMGMSARTLSRRLADENVTYSELVDNLRQSLALQYLKDSGVSLAQIAWLLGYEDAASFSHASRRWTGQTPSALRRRLTMSETNSSKIAV
jgi:AraC-like DNA-binding protein